MTEARNARLFVLAGPDLARSFALGARSTLGRSDECDVVLRDRSISRKHALLVREEQGWFVQDLGSTNGVTKNGQRGERFELLDGDEFRLGDLPLRFKLQAEEVQDIEFDLAPPVVRAAAAAPPASAPPASVPPASAPVPSPAVRAAPSPRKDDDDEIQIEGPDEPMPASSAVRPEAAATAFRPVQRTERRSGFFSGDLEQQPFWLRVALFLGLLAVGAGLAYGAFQAVQMLRAGT